MKPGKPEFIEEFDGPKVDPLFVTHADFDFDEIGRRLGEEPINQAEELRHIGADLVARIFEFVTRTPSGTPPNERTIGRRFAALAWVLNPGLFEGSPSATKLAALLEIKCSGHFKHLTGEASLEFGITNRGQAHAWNRGSRKEKTP